MNKNKYKKKERKLKKILGKYQKNFRVTYYEICSTLLVTYNVNYSLLMHLRHLHFFFISFVKN